MKKALFILLLAIACKQANAQDTPMLKERVFSLHAQATIIPQKAFKFTSPYEGDNSFLPTEPIRTSFTTTLFAAYKPFRNTYFVFNPEIAAGKGLSKTTGVAGFTNGEIYRVGDPAPQLFVARLYAEQRFPLSKVQEVTEDGINQVQHTTSKEYISLIAGKFALTDFFDNSDISHDPRTQFMNWSLMANGAWDYPANVRGYTYGVVVQAIFKNMGIRIAQTAIPMEANGTELQWKGKDAGGTVVEFAINRFNLFRKKKEGHYHSLHIGLYSNRAKMGNYTASINTGLQTLSAPDITDSRLYGRTKNGYYLTLENHMGKVHHFVKHSRNDGKNETWAFTEIDKSVATGFRFDGDLWKRKNDCIGIAYVRNDLSSSHKQYLANGGYGFIIGDGKLNYGAESIVEFYYSFNVVKKICISPDYQFIVNPAYNKDRGPVSVASLRLHVDL